MRWNTGTVNGFEHVILNDGGSRVMGSDSHATVFEGGDGDDWIRSKLGADVIAGGAGADTFAYLKKDTADGSVDTIADFEVGVDRLDMSDFLKGGRTADDGRPLRRQRSRHARAGSRRRPVGRCGDARRRRRRPGRSRHPGVSVEPIANSQ